MIVPGDHENSYKKRGRIQDVNDGHYAVNTNGQLGDGASNRNAYMKYTVPNHRTRNQAGAAVKEHDISTYRLVTPC